MLLDEVEITSSGWLDGAERQFPPFIKQMEMNRRVVNRRLAAILEQVPLDGTARELVASTRPPESSLTTEGASRIQTAKITRKSARHEESFAQRLGGSKAASQGDHRLGASPLEENEPRRQSALRPTVSPDLMVAWVRRSRLALRSSVDFERAD